MSSTERFIPGGQPSTTQPIAGPWLSPKEVTVKILPNVLPAMAMRCVRLLHQIELDPQLLELIRRHRGWRIGQRTLRFLGLGERDDVTDGVRAGEQHEEPVEAKGDATVGRGPVLEGLEQKTEFRLRLVLADPQQIENFELDLAPVIPDTSPADFVAVQDHIVRLSSSF